MCDQFGSLNCTELKIELSKRGAKTTGKKAELVERLRAYERNLDFSGRNAVINLPEDLYMPIWPQRVVFKTLTLDQCQSLPPIQFEHLQQVIKITLWSCNLFGNRLFSATNFNLKLLQHIKKLFLTFHLFI